MNWFYHTIWLGYFWASLKGNGPEALVQTIVYGAIAIIFVPPIRRWFMGHFHSVKEHISAEQAKIHDKMNALRESHDIMHTKVDAIIQHHGISPDPGAPAGKILGKSPRARKK